MSFPSPPPSTPNTNSTLKMYESHYQLYNYVLNIIHVMANKESIQSAIYGPTIFVQTCKRFSLPCILKKQILVYYSSSMFFRDENVHGL